MVSASIVDLLLRYSPLIAEEKIHAPATKETRRRKRRITPEMAARSSKTADDVAICLSSGLE
jgi:hypothetical protein